MLGHSFCTLCIKEWFDSCQNSEMRVMRCPECRRLIDRCPVPCITLNSLASLFQKRDDVSDAMPNNGILKPTMEESIWKGLFADFVGTGVIIDDDGTMYYHFHVYYNLL